MRRAEFEAIVEDALAGLPEHFQEHMDNIGVEVRDWPSSRMLKELGLGPGETLFGLYEGVPLLERQATLDPLMPDRIFIFQGPLEEHCRTRAELVREIQQTVVHEVGHHFSLSDETMHAIEDDEEDDGGLEGEDR